MPFQFSKKIIIIIIASIVVAVAIIFGVYFAYKKSKEILRPDIAIEKNEFEAVSSNIQNAEAKLKIISDQPVFDYWITGGPLVFIQDQTSPTVSVVAKAVNATSTATSTKLAATSSLTSLEKQVFYFDQNGRIFRAKDGDDEMISDRIFENLQKTEANKDGLMILIKYGSLTSPQIEIFNLVSKIWQPLNNVSAAAFSPDGTKIAYLENGKSQISDLITKDLIGKKKQVLKIFSLAQKDFDLNWFDNDKILLTQKPSYLYKSEIFSVSIKNKTISPFIDEYGLMLNWAKDGGEFGLKFESDTIGKNSKLNLIDRNGTLRANLGFLTLPDKCFIGLAKIYCAIPQSYTSFQEPNLPDDYLKRVAYSMDEIHEIDINQNSFVSLYSDAEPDLDAEHFELFGDRLLFINRYDNKVYGLAL